MKIKSYTIIVALILAITMQSCYVHRHTVGNGPVGRHLSAKKVSSSKQVYLFAGLIAIGNPNTANPPYGENGYQIKTSTNLVDMIIGGLTFGIITTRTVKIFVNHADANAIKEKSRTVQPTVKPK